MSAALFVANLSEETTAKELRDLFSTIGTVEKCLLILDRHTGRPKGLALVEMDTDESARSARDNLNGYGLRGKSMRVEEAKIKLQDDHRVLHNGRSHRL